MKHLGCSQTSLLSFMWLRAACSTGLTNVRMTMYGYVRSGYNLLMKLKGGALTDFHPDGSAALRRTFSIYSLTDEYT